jgi:curved DNA-binding protein
MYASGGQRRPDPVQPSQDFMEYKDYYGILGLERAATQDEVKRAYRKLARKYHPDLNKEAGAEAKFKEVGEAYEVLGDPEKRAAYDQLGADLKSGQPFEPPPSWDAGYEFSGAGPGGARHGGGFEPGSAGHFSDFFESLFGGMGRRRSADGAARAEFHAPGEDHHAKIVIDLRDTLEGATRSITLKAPYVDADGHVGLRERTLNVSIPKGLTPGQHIRLRGQGGPGLGRGASGDLYLQVEIAPDRLYRVSGKDLYLDLPVAPWEAALGASVRMPTPRGPIMLKIPAGSRQGQELRVRGRGIPAAEPGDLYAVLTIVLPPADTEQARELYQRMASELAFDPRKRFEE